MSQQSAGASGAIPKSGGPYRIERRTRRKRGGGPLSGYAVDITIRVNSEESYFLEDHNSDRNVMPHTNRQDLIETLKQELERNHIDHFGHP
jgi:hypothetical protein